MVRRLTLVLTAVLALIGATSPAARAGTPAEDLAAALGSNAAGGAFLVRDNQGVSMDTLKVVQAGSTYLGVYHTCPSTGCSVRLATSTNLTTWTYKRTLDSSASQPYLAHDGSGYLLAVESGTNNHVRLRHYASLTKLYNGSADRRFDAPRTLSSCAEGTPSILGDSGGVISLDLHYFSSCTVDREATATLTNWTTWSAHATPERDAALTSAGAAGKHGDRDRVVYEGTPLMVIEGQTVLNDNSTWQLYVYDPATGEAVHVDMVTAGGSTSFANPSVTALTTPAGQSVLEVGTFLFSEGTRSPDRAGEHTYTVPVT